MWYFLKIVFIFYSLDHERIFKGEKNNVMYDFIFENDIFQRSQLHCFNNEVIVASERHTPISVTHVHRETTILVLCNVINSQGAGTDSGCENCG